MSAEWGKPLHICKRVCGGDTVHIWQLEYYPNVTNTKPCVVIVSEQLTIYDVMSHTLQSRASGPRVLLRCANQCKIEVCRLSLSTATCGHGWSGADDVLELHQRSSYFGYDWEPEFEPFEKIERVEVVRLDGAVVGAKEG